MKTTLKKVIACLLVFSFVFAFAACNDDKDKETTTAAETTTVGETTVEATTVEGDTTAEATTVEGDTTVAGTTVPGETTTAAAAVTAPVGSDIAKVVAFYNQYGNAMKAYQGKVTVTKTDGTTSTIQSITGGAVVKNLALDMLPNDYKTKPTYTFVNGKSTVDNKDLSKWLPRDDNPKISDLSPTGDNGVKSASCVVSGSGWKVTIVMKDDATSGATALNDKPKYVSKCMDTLGLSNEDLDPFTLENANVNYTGCTIEAVFDAQGRFTKLDITTPANITGKLKYGIIGINADVTGTYKGNYTFTY